MTVIATNMKQAWENLYNLYMKSLLDLNLGYPLSEIRLKEMMDLMNMIYYTCYADSSDYELLTILDYYGWE